MERQTLSFVIARTQDNSTAIIFCNVLLKQVPAFPVSTQQTQRLLSHQITSHLNTHIVGILQINVIRILLPGAPPGYSRLHCVWMKLMSSCHSGVASDCWASREDSTWVSVRCQNGIGGSPPSSAPWWCSFMLMGLASKKHPVTLWLVCSHGLYISSGALSSDGHDCAMFHSVSPPVLKYSAHLVSLMSTPQGEPGWGGGMRDSLLKTMFTKNENST